MAVRLVVDGSEQVGAWLKGLDAEVKARVVKAVNSGANAIRNDVVDNIRNGEKTGRMYGDHQASAPGEAPATDTGELISGVSFEIDSDGFGASVISRAPYSLALELGTSGNRSIGKEDKIALQGPGFGDGHIEPRPFMLPAFEKNREAIQEAIADAYNGAKS